MAQSRDFNLPQVTTVLEDSEGTLAHPLPTEEYLYPPSRPNKNVRFRPAEAWAGNIETTR